MPYPFYTCYNSIKFLSICISASVNLLERYCGPYHNYDINVPLYVVCPLKIGCVMQTHLFVQKTTHHKVFEKTQQKMREQTRFKMCNITPYDERNIVRYLGLRCSVFINFR